MKTWQPQPHSDFSSLVAHHIINSALHEGVKNLEESHAVCFSLLKRDEQEAALDISDKEKNSVMEKFFLLWWWWRQHLAEHPF